MRRLVWAMFLALAAHAVHADETDLVDVEQAITDSEAAKDLAKDTKQRIARDRREAAAREREAVVMKEKADRKRKEAAEELARNEVILKELNKRIRNANSKVSAAERVIADQEKTLAKKREQLNAAREQLKLANDERDKRDHRIAELKGQTDSQNKEILKAKKEIIAAKDEYQRKAQDETVEQTRLSFAIKKSLETQEQVKQSIERMKEAYQKKTAQTDALRARLAIEQDKEKQAKENLAWAKQQLENQKNKDLSAHR